MNGWIKLHRKLLQWEWYSCHNTTRVFIHLLLTASWKDSRWQGLEIPRGSVFASPETLAVATGLSRQKIRTVLERLKSTNEITTKSTKRGTLITLSNFETYNCADCDSNQLDNQLDNQPLTNPQPTSNQPLTTSKEGKDGLEGPDVKKPKPPISPKGEDGFDEFWKIYPKKIGKEAARRAWIKAKPKIDEVIRSLSWQVRSEQWKKDNGQYIPNPSTWINQGRWNDEPTNTKVSIPVDPSLKPPDGWRDVWNDPEVIGFAEKSECGGVFASWRYIPEHLKEKVRQAIESKNAA